MAFWVSFPEKGYASDRLVVSNMPERVSGPTALFGYDISAGQRVRVLYHHKNVSTVPLRFLISAKSIRPGQLKLRLGHAGPVLDEIFVGHKALERYWNAKKGSESLVSVIPSESYLLDIVVPPGEIVSGIFECQSDVPVMVQGRTEDMAYPEASYAIVSQQIPLGGVYDIATITRDIRYVAGDIVREIPVGGEPFVQDLVSGIPLKGNYGVLYRFVADIHNPELSPHTVTLLFSPVAGAARAIVRIEESLLETGNVGGRGFPPVVELWRVVVPPKSTKKLVFETIPQSGSYYPVNFVLRSDRVREDGISSL